MATITLETAPFRLPDDPGEQDLLAKYFRALGDPTRLRVLELLGDGERSVGELVAALAWTAAAAIIRRRHRARRSVRGEGR